VTVPDMLYVGGRWILQWKGYEPAVGKVTTTVAASPKDPPVNRPSSEGVLWAGPEETVWPMPVLFTQQTFCPAMTVTVLGLNVNELVAVMVALAPEPVQLAGGTPPPPPP
jgi:hypothetical protein